MSNNNMETCEHKALLEDVYKLIEHHHKFLSPGAFAATLILAGVEIAVTHAKEFEVARNDFIKYFKDILDATIEHEKKEREAGNGQRE